VDNVDCKAPVLQSPSGFQPEQTAANDDRLRPVCGLFDHAHAVVEGAEPENAVGQRLVVGPQTGHQRKERPTAAGQNQRVVRGGGAVVGMHQVSEPVDPHHTHPCAQIDVVVGVPVQRVQIYLGRIVTAGEHVRQHDAVVVAVRFVPNIVMSNFFAAAREASSTDQT
jgi:hypothetical protein